MAGAMTEIKFWIAASDCGDVSVTAIFDSFFDFFFFFSCAAQAANCSKNTRLKSKPRSYWEATRSQNIKKKKKRENPE